jgi:hypothetical protein
MSLHCVLGRHEPLATTISRGQHGLVAICRSWATPLERPLSGKWTASEPLDLGPPNRPASVS